MGPRESVRVPVRALLRRHPESQGATLPPALGGVRTCQKRPRPGFGAEKGRPGSGPSGCPPSPALRRGQEPGAGGPVHVVGDAQPPPIPAPRSLPAAGATASAPARRPAAARPSGFTHLAPPPRLPHVTARPRAPRLQQRWCRRTPGDPARPPPLPASSPGRRQRTCCAACHGRSGFAAPPQPHNNMAAAASAGSRGAGRGQMSRQCNQKMEMIWTSGLLRRELPRRATVPAANFMPNSHALCLPVSDYFHCLLCPQSGGGDHSYTRKKLLSPIFQ
ncbi:uncharacterized protein RBU33_025298 [Hipposideros larvatus]